MDDGRKAHNKLRERIRRVAVRAVACRSLEAAPVSRRWFGATTLNMSLETDTCPWSKATRCQKIRGRGPTCTQAGINGLARLSIVET
jgi:hypothetical protein